MSNELNIAVQETDTATTDNNTPAATNINNFDQSGEGTNIGVAQNVNQNICNVYLALQGNPVAVNNTEFPKQIRFNLDFYSLFVINGETFTQPYFTIDIDRALNVAYGTTQEIHDRLALFDHEAISEIKKYPAIFAAENYRYCRSDERIAKEQFAIYGIVTDVKPMQNGKMKIFYEKIPMCQIPQELLNLMLEELDIQGNYKLNELDKTHWSIKNINLIEELKQRGICLFAPTL